MKTLDELKPVRCGCGGEAKVEYWVGRWYVRCKNANCLISTKNCDTEAEAITAWNTAMGYQFREVTKKIERTAKVVRKQRDVNGDYWGKCGECGNMVFGTYCSKCGARLEWE